MKIFAKLLALFSNLQIVADNSYSDVFNVFLAQLWAQVLVAFHDCLTAEVEYVLVF